MSKRNSTYPTRSYLVKKTPSGDLFIDGVDISSIPSELYACICKLRDYEESGFSPADVMVLKRLYDDAVDTMKKLRGEIAEMKSKLFEFPVRPGDVLYDCREYLSGDVEAPMIDRIEVCSVSISTDPDTHKYEYRVRERGLSITRRYTRDDFGAFVFLDPEKAKIFALKKLSERGR